ncbi:MAG: hypothetical protein IH610_12220 [Deltaproteobacteria bacterium]|nr:hypothetical protein [Deltaproteobacteria bacterium]
MVKRISRTLLLFVGPFLILSACATGSSLYVPGDLARSPLGVAAPAAGVPQALIADFSFAAAPNGVIGRDFDRARPIVWNGEPGKAMADLVAGALGERGVGTVRPGPDTQGVGALPARISGTLTRFEVNSRRTGNLTVTTEATVSISVTAEGPGVAGSLERTITSSSSLPGLFVTVDDIRGALLSVANTVADEVARTMIEAKVVTPSP